MNKNLKKSELVENLWFKLRMGPGSKGRNRLHVSRAQAAHLVEAVVSTIAEALEEGKDIPLPRFGKFSVKQHEPGSTVYDPRKRQHIPRRPDRMRTIRFRASSILRKRLNAVEEPTGSTK